MYTNTIKIEYLLYKICTAVVRVKASPICSVCLWWCSEGLTVGPGGEKIQQILVLHLSHLNSVVEMFWCAETDYLFTHRLLTSCSLSNRTTVKTKSVPSVKECKTFAGNDGGGRTVPCQTSARAITASWSCDRAETRYWTTSGPIGRPHKQMWSGRSQRDVWLFLFVKPVSC